MKNGQSCDAPAPKKWRNCASTASRLRLPGRDYLEGEFTAGDLMMVTVLRILRHTELVKNMPVLAAYQARCEARPAFQRALAAQLAPFEKYAPAA